MISEQDKIAIINIARRYGVREVLLFGSAADPQRQANDIDLAVSGVRPEEFFTFYGDLIFGLSKPVDLIDLSTDSKFNKLICRDGVRLYAKSA